jgi:very-short-patch-repair endonuclease
MSLSRAKKLRGKTTDAEHRLWYRFRAHRFAGTKFKRQVPLGRHIVDFVCFVRRVVIEVDGGQHADDPNDAARDDWLRGEGFVVLRFWNTDVLKRTDVVLEESPRPKRRGREYPSRRAQPSLRRLRKLACGAPPSPTRGEGTLRLQLT